MSTGTDQSEKPASADANMSDTCPPTEMALVMIASEMNDAINAYSIADEPDRSLMKREINLIISTLCLLPSGPIVLPDPVSCSRSTSETLAFA